MKRSTLVDGSLRGTQFHRIRRNLDNSHIREEPLYAVHGVDGRRAQCWESMIHVVKLVWNGVLLARIAKLRHSLLGAFQRTRQTATTLLDNAGFIASFIVGGTCYSLTA
ncbi:MAG: hypothetical protein ABSA57_19005 [Candidatus Acidiferrales bacterium]